MGWLLQDLVVTTVLACGVWAMCRWGRLGPVARHALWAVVLVKLLVPPLVAWPWAVKEPLAVLGVGGSESEMVLDAWMDEPGKTSKPGARGLAGASATGNGANAAVPPATDHALPAGTGKAIIAAPPQASHLWTWEHVRWTVAAIWLLGGLAFLGLQVVRIVRMVLRVRGARQGDSALAQRVGTVARRLGVRRVRTRVVPGLGGPYIWALGRPLLLWPAELSADAPGAAGLIAHELAHVKRRDHWIGWMELLAGCVWWWNPVYWHTCRQLRENAELACDAWVVEAAGGTIGQTRRGYAEALLAVCAAMPRGVPLPAVGVNSGGKRILERRLTMIMCGNVRLRLPRLGSAAVVAVALAAIPAWSAGAAEKLPFTVSKETTLVTGPLNADGTPDYLAARNAQASQGVTPENNAFVAWAEAFEPGPSAAPYRLTKPMYAQALALAGAKMPPPGQRLVYFNRFLVDRKLATEENAWQKYTEFDALRWKLWTAEEYPEAAAYLKSVDGLLDLAVAAADRTRWWAPFVSRYGAIDMGISFANQPELREVANVLCVRATLRAETGDWAGCRRDVLAVKRLGSLLGHSTVLIERLIGISLDSWATRTVGAIAASGKLTEGQCADLRKSLRDIPAIEGTSTGLDLAYRAVTLQSMILVATGRVDAIRATIEAWETDAGPDIKPSKPAEFTDLHNDITAFASIDRDAVDWNEALKQANKMLDPLSESGQAVSEKDLQVRTAALDKQLADWKAIPEVIEGGAKVITLRKKAGESRADYTTRIAQAMVGRLAFDPGNAEELYRRSRMQDDMAQVLLAAAERKAKAGAWPARAEELVPEFFREIPRDIFSADGAGTEALKYKVTDHGPRVYSTGTVSGDLGIGAEL